jgi:hypothetical protein
MQALASPDVQQDDEKEPGLFERFLDYPEVDESFQHVRRLSDGKVLHRYDD